MAKKYQKFGWSAASQMMPDSYYSEHNVWHVAFSKGENPLRVEIGPKLLHSDTEAAGLYEDEGGPLSLEPDEQEQLFVEAIQSIIPDGMLMSCRVFKDVRGFFMRPVFDYAHIGSDKQRLAQVYTRFGVDPDSIADYLFVSADPAAHEEATIQAAAKTMDESLHPGFGKRQLVEQQLQRLIDMARLYDPLIWALDGFLFVTTYQQSMDEIKDKLALVAAKHKLELPRYDFVLNEW